MMFSILTVCDLSLFDVSCNAVIPLASDVFLFAIDWHLMFVMPFFVCIASNSLFWKDLCFLWIY